MMVRPAPSWRAPCWVRLTRWLGGAQLARDDQLSAKDGKHVAALGEMFFNRSTVTTTKQSNRRS